MDLTAFTQIILRRGWLVVIAGLLGALAGLAYAATRAPGYEATTRVAMQPARQADYGQTQAVKELMQSMLEDIRTYGMADAVAARLGEEWLSAHGMDAGSMRYMLDSGNLGTASDINIYEIRITARSSDPGVAVQVSEKWAETFADRREKANLELDRDDRIAALIRDEPVPSQYAPRRKLLVALGLVAGTFLGIVLMLLAAYFDSAVVRGPREAERASGAALLGTLPPVPGEPRGAGVVRQGLDELGPAAATLLRRGWPIAALALVGAIAAFGFSRVQPTEYRARSRVALEPASPSNWGNTQAIRETMRGYTEDIRTRRMARQVNDRLQLDMSAEALLDKLNVAEQTGVYELVIDVFDPDPEVATRISRAWAEAFIESHRVADDTRDQRDRILVRLRDLPRVAPWSPQTGINTAAGAVLGALVGAAAVLLLGFVRSGLVQTTGDASRAAGAPLLGVIPPAEHHRASAA